ncbi:DNA-binding MarR family transcriptional regulator [Azospirillum brasilense]|uniref:DNA-binding MarR family transcriptional regulator n=1 Tax=Azospirillum brasilense TaxID=192 RepID=A0A560CKP8_AZOBR|nr:MarR family winged helix-turn-helix transcriptional regulator [Azospirillum brasilense]TWA85450.1 DNA-binding MarR family transcriptional regulator [Azospirillum brasilense]
MEGLLAEPNISPLDAHLGYWLRFVSNHVSHAFAAMLAERGVTVAEWVVLRDLHSNDGVAPSLLADRLGMTRGAISKLADRLAAKGLLTQTADADDRRYQTLALTPQGRALVPDLSAMADRNDANFFGHLDHAERARIEETLKGIVRRMGLRSIPID